MKQNQIPKWQEEIEKILQGHFVGEELSRHLKIVCDLGELTREVKPPTGDIGLAVAAILKHASEELYPLAVAYSAFTLGVAYEKFQNTKGR